MGEHAALDPIVDKARLEGAVARGHEFADIPVRGIAAFAIIMAVAFVVIFVVAAWMTRHLANADLANSGPASAHEPDTAPPEPRQQYIPSHPTSDDQDLDALKKRQTALLSQYGPAGEAAARIPIDRAMALALRAGRSLASTKPVFAPAPGTQPATRTAAPPPSPAFAHAPILSGGAK